MKVPFSTEASLLVFVERRCFNAVKNEKCRGASNVEICKF